MPRTLTLTEAADMLKVHVDTVSDGWPSTSICAASRR